MDASVKKLKEALKKKRKGSSSSAEKTAEKKRKTEEKHAREKKEREAAQEAIRAARPVLGDLKKKRKPETWMECWQWFMCECTAAAMVRHAADFKIPDVRSSYTRSRLAAIWYKYQDMCEQESTSFIEMVREEWEKQKQARSAQAQKAAKAAEETKNDQKTFRSEWTHITKFLQQVAKPTAGSPAPKLYASFSPVVDYEVVYHSVPSGPGYERWDPWYGASIPLEVTLVGVMDAPAGVIPDVPSDRRSKDQSKDDRGPTNLNTLLVRVKTPLHCICQTKPYNPSTCGTRASQTTWPKCEYRSDPNVTLYIEYHNQADRRYGAYVGRSHRRNGAWEPAGFTWTKNLTSDDVGSASTWPDTYGTLQLEVYDSTLIHLARQALETVVQTPPPLAAAICEYIFYVPKYTA